jgi:hypothetical protein
VSREDDYVELRDDTLVPGRFLNEKYPQMVRPIEGHLGVNVGGQTTFNIGARINYGLRNTKIELMPEFYYGVADPFCLSGNFIYPFKALILSIDDAICGIELDNQN